MSAVARSMGPPMFSRSCAPAIILVIAMAALGCIVAAASSTAAELEASQLSGRWSRYVADPTHACRDASCRLAYDLVRCAGGWCGIEVNDNKECGRVAFHLDGGTPTQGGVEFSGRYEKAGGTQPYVIKANLSVHPKQQSPNEQLMLSVLGSTDGNFQPWRRTYPLHIVLVRDGDAVCRAQPKLSSAQTGKLP